MIQPDTITLLVHSDHIMNYGFFTDLFGETIWGVERGKVEELLKQGYEIHVREIVNPYAELYTAFEGEGAAEVQIPRGTLIVSAVKMVH